MNPYRPEKDESVTANHAGISFALQVSRTSRLFQSFLKSCNYYTHLRMQINGLVVVKDNDAFGVLLVWRHTAAQPFGPLRPGFVGPRQSLGVDPS